MGKPQLIIYFILINKKKLNNNNNNKKKNYYYKTQKYHFNYFSVEVFCLSVLSDNF